MRCCIPLEAYLAKCLRALSRRRTRAKIVFFASDVEEARDRLIARGAKLGPVKASGDLRLCDGRDPEGNVFQISNRS